VNVNFWEIFLFAFVAAAGGYSFLASCTTVFYRKKAWGQLSPTELKVKQGSASFENRIDLFIRTLFVSLFTYQIYLLAFMMGGLMYLVMLYFNR
jgi:hypothetical protein